jgi:hypothetical protein
LENFPNQYQHKEIKSLEITSFTSQPFMLRIFVNIPTVRTSLVTVFDMRQFAKMALGALANLTFQIAREARDLPCYLTGLLILYLTADLIFQFNEFVLKLVSLAC